MRRLTVLLLLVIAVAVAQEPQPFAWWDRPMARALNLSPEQEKQVRAIQREFRDRLLDQRTAVQKAEANLRDLMDEDQVNEAGTREAIDRVVEARGELMRSVSQMALRMRMVLTTQQWQRVQRRTEQMLQQRRPAQPAPPKSRRPGPGPVY